MYTVVRTYSGAGAKELIDVLESRKSEIEAVIRAVPGVVTYTLVRTADGGMSMTVCQDKAGADASVQVAREWTQKNAPGVTASPTAMAEGTVVLLVK